ncbi:MAG: hypothetical protein E5W97_02615 [Mesorhizobium sp.]|nr:MAG: hypothetical protein E5V40_00460 [Mesorhizobium sp.]TJW08140.1 MAG: hypothetical protein E5W97_02615 [Mesorhizobium sp.]
MQGFVSFDDIVRTSTRIAFTENDLTVAASVLKAGREKDRDLVMGATGIAANGQEFLDLANRGIVVFTSRHQLNASFLFTKNDAGRSLFGSQKAVYTAYVNSFDDDEWAVGSVFKMWTMAMTSIGNVYRGNGYR